MGGKEILIKSIAQALPVFCDDGIQNPKKHLQRDVRCHICGVTTMIIEGFIGKLGGSYVYQRRGAAWALGILKALIEPSLPNKYGGCYWNQILYVPEFYEQDITLMGNF